MAVTVAQQAPRYVGALGGGSVGMNQFVADSNKDGGTATYKKGELVTLPITGIVTTASGNIIGAAGTNDKLDVSATANTIAKKIYGIAMKDEAAAAAIAPVGLFVPGTVIVINLTTGIVGRANPATYTLLATDYGRKVALIFDDTNRKWMATVTATEECATIIGFPGTPGFSQSVLGSDAGNEGGVGDVNVRVFIVIDDLITKFQGLVTAA